jgi:hypothetical protein
MEFTPGFFYIVRTVHFGMKLYNEQRNAQVFNLFIYFYLACFGLSFSPSSEAGVQFRQWFKSPGYGARARALTPYLLDGGQFHAPAASPSHHHPHPPGEKLWYPLESCLGHRNTANCPYLESSPEYPSYKQQPVCYTNWATPVSGSQLSIHQHVLSYIYIYVCMYSIYVYTVYTVYTNKRSLLHTRHARPLDSHTPSLTPEYGVQLYGYSFKQRSLENYWREVNK